MENPLIGRRVQEEGGRFEGTIAAVGIDQAPGPSAELRWSFVVVADSGLVSVIKAHGATVTGWERPAM